DYILPATTYFENESYQRHASGYVQIRQRVIPPLGEARSDYLIFAALAQRLGYGDRYPQTERDLLEFAFGGDAPVSLEDVKAHPGGVQVPQPAMVYRKYERGLLRKDGQPGWPTPSGKVEIASSLLEKSGYDALPIYIEPLASPVTMLGNVSSTAVTSSGVS